MLVSFLRKSFKLASKIGRTILADPSVFLRGFFDTSRRIPEAASRSIEEVSKKPRRMCGDGTAVIRKKSKVKSEKSKNIHFFVLRLLQPFWLKNI